MDDKCFSIKCPKCKIKLEANKKHIGMKVACETCDFHFILFADAGKEVENYNAMLVKILSERFSNGIRIDSLIELTRFRAFAAEDIPYPDDVLKRHIAACGITFENKVYAVSLKVKEQIKALAEEYFSGGAQVIFYAEFFSRNEKRLFEANVVSEGMTVYLLRELFPKLSFTQTYFGFTDASISSVLESEIIRVWGQDNLLTYEQLGERLKYVPAERIKSALGQSGDFIWNSVGTFSHVSKIDIPLKERETICATVERECNTRGYASIANLPLEEIEACNHTLSITAIHNAVYRICLSDKFDKKGKIITRKGDVFNALSIMKEYCRTVDKCSLDDLVNYERELTGEVHHWAPMGAANAVLVRLDKDTYVADRHVSFEIDAIDNAIGAFLKKDYLPLKSITTFGSFPDCGQAWNLFLLESFCRRFSREFRFDAPAVNSRNAGVIIRKSCGMNYTEIMADAIANADIPMEDVAVGKFLYENGYIGKSVIAKVNEIVTKAKSIREKMR